MYSLRQNSRAGETVSSGAKAQIVLIELFGGTKVPPYLRTVTRCGGTEVPSYLVELFRNDEEHFDGCGMAALAGRPELPLAERIEHEAGMRESLREGDGQPFEMAGLIEDPMHHQRIAVDIAGEQVGADDVVRPRGV